MARIDNITERTAHVLNLPNESETIATRGGYYVPGSVAPVVRDLDRLCGTDTLARAYNLRRS